MQELFFVLMMLVDGMGALALVALSLHNRVESFGIVVRIGLAMLMIGLLGQFGRDVQCITGVCPTDAAWPPLWALKDMGAAILAVGFLMDFALDEKQVIQ